MIHGQSWSCLRGKSVAMIYGFDQILFRTPYMPMLINPQPGDDMTNRASHGISPWPIYRNRWFTELKNGDFPWRTVSYNQMVRVPY